MENVRAMIDTEVATGIRPDNIFVCGFSQGCRVDALRCVPSLPEMAESAKFCSLSKYKCHHCVSGGRCFNLCKCFALSEDTRWRRCVQWLGTIRFVSP